MAYTSAAQGNKYNIPVAIWLMPTHPHTPPAVMVTPTENMALKSGHRHVDKVRSAINRPNRPSNAIQEGFVYIPYLSEWKAGRSSLRSLVSVLAQVFSADPPVRASRPGENTATTHQRQAGASRRTPIAQATQKLQEAFRAYTKQRVREIDEEFGQSMEGGGAGKVRVHTSSSSVFCH